MPKPDVDSEDLFADSRMTFGEHIEDLRLYLLRALKGLAFFVVIGFTLDAVGYFTNQSWIGIGRPVMGIITSPVRQRLRLFYDNRLKRLEANRDKGDAEALRATAKQPVRVIISPEDIAKIRATKEIPSEPIEFTMMIDPLDSYKAGQKVQNEVRPPELTTLSVAESMLVYFKVSMLASFILASPYVFWQIWSFIAAGLYPHEKHYVHKYLPMSLTLFLGGVLLCQYAVIPQSISALLWFNDWLGFTPDLRLNEWLGFAILMPLVFGIAFQTPIVMLLLNRVGIMTVDAYVSGWRIAVFSLAVMAAIITPTPDAYTMILMWLPLCGLYFLGIYLCKLSGGPTSRETVDVDDEYVEA